MMKLCASVFVFLVAIVAGTISSDVEARPSRHLHQTGGAISQSEVCDGSTCTTFGDDGSVSVNGVPPGGDVSCFTNCAAQTTGQLECIQACTEEATSGSPSTSAASGTSRSMSCANGVCTVKTCDSSGNCVTSESDDSGNVSASSGDDAVTIPVPGVEQRSSSSSATVTASSGPDGVVTDVQTSGDGARGTATASNSMETETTTCEGDDCETISSSSGDDASASPAEPTSGDVQNSMGSDGAIDDDGGETSVEIQGNPTSGAGPERDVATGVLLALVAGAALLGM